ncbi:GTP 3',8-cyclase MoaA [Croceiramulus getboli]|nr:GTP 3',8-cyclase MoaA [Flavobacteriaceae bacterium YJPT1-3]
MTESNRILTDQHQRIHNYLRISLTERCNLRCSYCMPQEGVPLTPKPHLMNAEELVAIAGLFVEHGVDKIRLTGGEPLVRKDFPEIISALSQLPVKLSITTNGVSIDRHLELLQNNRVETVNLSLDTLDAAKFKKITFRNYFDAVYTNMHRLLDHGIKVKINVVLMKGINDDEIIDFIELTKDQPFIVRFIEFMPFDGNQWNREKTVAEQEILDLLEGHYQTKPQDIIRLEDAPNDTARNFKIDGYQGQFGIISTVTNPFCDSCNRLRLTANGHLKNCLFSGSESDLLTPFRLGEDLRPLIQKAVWAKKVVRAGLSTPEQFNDPKEHQDNRSMIRIGG